MNLPQQSCVDPVPTCLKHVAAIPLRIIIYFKKSMKLISKTINTLCLFCLNLSLCHILLFMFNSASQLFWNWGFQVKVCPTV